MTMNDLLADDRSLNGNHTPACALPTRGGVCDCWPPATDAGPLHQRSTTAGSDQDPANGTGGQLVA